MIYHALPGELTVAILSVDQPSSRVGVPEVTKHIFVAQKPEGYTIKEGGRQLDRFSEQSPDQCRVKCHISICSVYH